MKHSGANKIIDLINKKYKRKSIIDLCWKTDPIVSQSMFLKN